MKEERNFVVIFLLFAGVILRGKRKGVKFQRRRNENLAALPIFEMFILIRPPVLGSADKGDLK
jgi:hypothetical protein